MYQNFDIGLVFRYPSVDIRYHFARVGAGAPGNALLDPVLAGDFIENIAKSQFRFSAWNSIPIVLRERPVSL